MTVAAVGAGVAAAAAVASAGIQAGTAASAARAGKAGAKDSAAMRRTAAQNAYDAELTGGWSDTHPTGQLDRWGRPIMETTGGGIGGASEKLKAMYQNIFGQEQEALAKKAEMQRLASSQIYTAKNQARPGMTDILTRAQTDQYNRGAQGLQQALDQQLAGEQGGYESRMAGSNKALSEYEKTLAAQKGYFTPYHEGGLKAYASNQDLTGMNGREAQQRAIDLIKSGSQFSELAAQGEDALLQNAAATGGIRGGNTQGALAQFRPQMLQQLINTQFSNLSGLTSQGQFGTQGLSQAESVYGANRANEMNAQGGYGADLAINQGNQRAQYYRDVSDLDVQKIANLAGISYDNALSQLNDYIGYTGGISDININELVDKMRSNTANVTGQYTTDADRLLKEAGLRSTMLKEMGGINSEERTSQAQISANKANQMGSAIQTGLGGLASAAGGYFGGGGNLGGLFAQKPTIAQPKQQQYGFAGMNRQQTGSPMSRYNQGQPVNTYW